MEINTKIEYVNINDLKVSKRNPRKISPKELQKLCDSIEKDKGFLECRPILIDQNNEIYGGTQRYEACKILGYKKVPVIKTEISEETKKERVIKDNNHNGEWDLDILQEDFGKDFIIDQIKDIEIDEQKQEKDTTDKKLVEQIELNNFESYNYFVFAFRDDRDFIYCCQKLGIQKVDGSFSPKLSKIGIGRIIEGERLAKLL